MGSISSISVDLGPVGAILCLNLTVGALLKVLLSISEANSSKSFFKALLKLYATVGLL